MSTKWKILTSLLAFGFLLTLWYFYDEDLDAETKQWLTEPPTVKAKNDVRPHILALYQISPTNLNQVVGSSSCNKISQECANFVESHREEIKARLPSDPQYWSAFEESLNATGISGDLSVVKNNQLFNGDYIAAVQLSYIHELVEYGRVRPDTAIKVLMAQRYFLGKAPFLIDKMVYSATTWFAFQGLAMALQTTQSDDPVFNRILNAASPLTKGELSYARVLKNELRYFQDAIYGDFAFPGELGLKPQHALNFQRQWHSHIVELSQLSEYEFWRMPKIDTRWHPNAWNWFVDPVATSRLSHPNYMDYLLTLRLLDITATAIRGWGGMRKSNKELAKDLPDEPSPPGWKWEWENTRLCLKSTSTIPWADPMDDICLPKPAVQITLLK